MKSLTLNILRARIINLEYENLNEIEIEIKRIYFEDIGVELATNVSIY